MTQASASTTFDLPEPLGPTTAVTPGSKCRVVLEANDLNPLRVSDFRCTDDSRVAGVRRATITRAATRPEQSRRPRTSSARGCPASHAGSRQASGFMTINTARTRTGTPAGTQDPPETTAPSEALIESPRKPPARQDSRHAQRPNGRADPPKEVGARVVRTVRSGCRPDDPRKSALPSALRQGGAQLLGNRPLFQFKGVDQHVRRGRQFE